MKGIYLKFINFFKKIKSLGANPAMDSYEKRRLGIFNLLNFFAFISGVTIPVAGLFNSGYLPPLAWVVACSPALISGVVLLLNYYQRLQFSLLWYFVMYPVFTALVYSGSVDAGVELFFILYGVLAVFFLQKLNRILFAVVIAVACYSFIFLVPQQYQFVLREINFPFYIFNHILSICFIFLGLFLIKKENTEYQFEIISSNRALHKKNIEVEKQSEEIIVKANLLEEQTAQLTELNAVKNRLFSIISHDLRTPIYGLRNLFKSMQQYDLPGEEIKVLVPDILNDLTYATSLMENLLQWAKSQMEGASVNPQLIDVSLMITEVQQLLRLQAENKKVYLKTKTDAPVYIYADKDMINLVLRNLLSNAIKFTPENGEVSLGAAIKNETVEVFVKDTGMGISKENISQLFGNNYFTTKGTANETGTGLGLMLCKEFLNKNGGEIFVQSEIGKGSRFSFIIPKA
ncbi:sensor histidine kinase [Ferruginibacter sp.]